MDELDYWRLCDELNVVQAALLIVGEAPIAAHYVEGWDVETRPRGYEAAKTAISHALKNYAAYTGVGKKTSLKLEYSPEDMQTLLRRSIHGKLIPEYETDMNGNPTVAIEGTVDVWRSTIEVESLRHWLRARGFSKGFFFPESSSDTPDYLDPHHPRYAPKLAAAVTAWQTVTDPGKKSPKQALEKWLRENAAQFGLIDDEGNPVNQAVEDCSKVANWNQTGGAPKLPGG
jgi:hypothetical protein